MRRLLPYLAWHTPQGFVAGLVLFFGVVIAGAGLLAWLGNEVRTWGLIGLAALVLSLVPFVVDQRALRRQRRP